MLNCIFNNLGKHESQDKNSKYLFPLLASKIHESIKIYVYTLHHPRVHLQNVK